jgi:hypothetical protein
MQSRSILGQGHLLIPGLAPEGSGLVREGSDIPNGLVREGSNIPSGQLSRSASETHRVAAVQSDAPDADQLELDLLPKGLFESREDDDGTPRRLGLAPWPPVPQVNITVSPGLN